MPSVKYRYCFSSTFYHNIVVFSLANSNIGSNVININNFCFLGNKYDFIFNRIYLHPSLLLLFLLFRLNIFFRLLFYHFVWKMCWFCNFLLLLLQLLLNSHPTESYMYEFVLEGKTNLLLHLVLVYHKIISYLKKILFKIERNCPGSTIL